MRFHRFASRGRLLLLAPFLVASVLAACSGSPASRDESSGGPEPAPTAEPDSEPTAPNPFGGDDTWIAYQTNRTGGEAVWLVHPDGTDDHQLDVGLSQEYLLPDWSPDGSHLVVTTRGGAHEPLVELELASGRARQLFACKRPCLGDDEPSYSPDGSTIAFVRALLPIVDGVPSDCGIWLGDRKTGRASQLTSNTDPPCDREYFVHWSPDGKQLTYQREIALPSGELTTAVFTVQSDGTSERRLTEPDMVAGEPAYSPDGDWIVFATQPLSFAQTADDSQLYRIHPDGTGMEQLTELADVRATQPRYSPDGNWILFTAVDPAERDLWAIPASGGEPVVIADSGAIYTHGVWQPTG